MTEDEMMSDLAAADAAGDSELAQHIAGKIKAARTPALSATRPEVSKTEALLRGAAMGATMGFGDELEAGWKSLFPKSLGGSPYRETRDKIRADEAVAREQHPYLYGGAEMAGAALPAAGMALATGGTSLAPAMAKAALPIAAGQGAVQGAGYSNADSAGGLARDVGVGTGLGVLGHGVGSALGGAGRTLVGSIRGRGVRAVAKAAEQAAEETAQGVKTATGSLGGEVQKGQRIVENLRRLGPDLSPEQQAMVNDLEQRLSASTLEALPGQAGTIAAKDAELAALKSGASEAFNARKADLLSPDEAKRQVMARVMRYGPPAAGGLLLSLLGHAVGGPVGAAAGGPIGLAGGAVLRPMIRSMRNLKNNPAVEKAVTDALTSDVVTTPGEFLRQLLARGAPAVASQQLVTQ